MNPAGFLVYGALFASLLTSVAYGGEEANAESQSLHFQFVLENDYSTSAGAFDAAGTLIRTLWSNRRYAAGRHEAVWDGRDDDGRAVTADAEYEIRVLTHNVIYTWDGVIGNTSSDATSPFHHDGPYFFNDLVIAGDRAFFTTPSEGAVPTMRYFRLDDPQSWRARPAIPMSHGADMGLIAADEDRVYWAHDSSPWKHAWGMGGDQAFVIATDRELSHEIVFEAGTATCLQRVEQRCYKDAEKDNNVRSAIDVVTDFREDPSTAVLEGARNNVTGLAVQASGERLFVAHGRLEPARIHVLDKRSGRLLARVPLAGVGRLVTGPGSEDLWAIHDSARGRVVSHLRVGAAPDFSLQTVRTLAGPESPIGVALTPDGTRIVVADGGSSQQLQAFDAATGQPVWQLGKKGGYAAGGPEVSPDKLSFHRYNVNSQTAERFEQTVLSFAPDGSFWVGDTGLSRVLKFGADRRYLDQIAFLPINYNVAVDRNDPSRVFAGYKEYRVEYRSAIAASWRLHRYFGDGPQTSRGYHAFDAGFVDVVTMRNGRTYGLLRARNGIELVEIPADGDLVLLPVKLQRPVFLNEQGDLYSVRAGAGGPAEFGRRPLEGFDEGDVPEWAREETSARVPRNSRDPRINPYSSSLERTVAQVEPNLHVIFDPANSDAVPDANRGQFHLAAVHSGADHWLWRASPAAGQFDFAQPDGVFDTSRPWYAGMAVTAADDQIVYNYHGEGWHNAGQANQFLHWYRDGLFVGQFGTPNERGIPPAAPGLAGNSLSLQLVRANGALYLWHNDENSHAGVHRWRLDGVEHMRELGARGRVGQQISLARISAPDSSHQHAVPTSLVVRSNGGRIGLTWTGSAQQNAGIDVQRLQPTYVGPRFESIASLPPGAESFVDAEPLAGEPTVYRVRTRIADGFSDYSNHVSLTAPARPVLLESQYFETPPPGLRDDFHPTATPDVDVRVIAEPGGSGNGVLRVFAQKPAGAGDWRARVRWTASSNLFRALNASTGQPRGSQPDLYRVQFRLRLLRSQLGPDSGVSVQADPGYDLFSTSGRRQNLMRLAAAQPDAAAGEWVPISFTFAALANGAGAEGLRQYRSTAPTELSIVLPVSLRADGDVVEFLMDDFSVSRLDSDAGGTT